MYVHGFVSYKWHIANYILFIIWARVICVIHIHMQPEAYTLVVHIRQTTVAN